MLPRVLLCEHDSVLAAIIVEVFKDERIDIVQCSNLTEIEAALDEYPDAVVVTDSWTNSRHRELSAAERDDLDRLCDRAAAVVVTTGRLWACNARELNLRPEVVVIGKPYDLDDVVAAVRTALVARLRS